MYKISRLMLILTVLVSFYSLAVLAMQLGGLAVYIVIGIVLIAAFAKRKFGPLTAFGTARWASCRLAGGRDARCQDGVNPRAGD